MKPFDRAELKIFAGATEHIVQFTISPSEASNFADLDVTNGSGKLIPISATLRWALGFVLRTLYFED